MVASSQSAEIFRLPGVNRQEDPGKWVGRSSLISTSQKLDMLKRYWVPLENSNFAEDAEDAHLKRKFNHVNDAKTLLEKNTGGCNDEYGSPEGNRRQSTNRVIYNIFDYFL
ncbi:hypothetical protein ILUMI_25640 [Ignelater luminosus]|uniref:Uncharacterized protein n=1 Tax=Ignelater luminosus TaxID=2038154 RepID=A0A8K0FXS1_IGNLU|nr:hypothetical protein ILUMI_25640 [Ignelater luminosus]